jgi:DNA-binding PadR family transcriptional regulator
MPGRRVVSNPLALAVLACLRESPMHPYEMATTMRSRGKEHSIKLNYGSLYTVVDNLAKHGFIEAGEAHREGRRPERTVYVLTAAGRAELEDWMSELLAVPVKEYPRFEAALSLLPVLAPEHVATLLRDRESALSQEITSWHAQFQADHGLPRLFLLELEYHLAMREAELSWVRGLLAEFDGGTFPGLDSWRRWQATDERPPEFEELAAGQGGGGEEGGRTS